MTDMVIPPAANEAAVNALKGTWTLFETCPELAHEVASEALAAALPHLRPLFETATTLGLKLGRKEAAEEIAAAIKRTASTTIDPGDGEVLMPRDVAWGLAREIGARETP